MTIYDILTITSLVLSVVSIWLALYFYKQSNKLSETIVNNLNEIKILTNKIEGFYNRIYEDTFSIMRRNYEVLESNNTNHIENQVKNKIIEEVQSLLKVELKNYSIENNPTETNINLIAENISHKSSKLEERVKEETYQSEILNIYNNLHKIEEVVLFDTLVNEATLKGIDYRDLMKELMKMKEKNILFFKDPLNALTTILKSN